MVDIPQFFLTIYQYAKKLIEPKLAEKDKIRAPIQELVKTYHLKYISEFEFLCPFCDNGIFNIYHLYDFGYENCSNCSCAVFCHGLLGSNVIFSRHLNEFFFEFRDKTGEYFISSNQKVIFSTEDKSKFQQKLQTIKTFQKVLLLLIFVIVTKNIILILDMILDRIN